MTDTENLDAISEILLCKVDAVLEFSGFGNTNRRPIGGHFDTRFVTLENLASAIDHFLETNPEYREQFVFAQIGVPSRTLVPQYQALDGEIDNLVEAINWRWSRS